jgi:hypothetical protein
MSVSDIAHFQTLYETYLKQTRFQTFRINGIANEDERTQAIEVIERTIAAELKP